MSGGVSHICAYLTTIQLASFFRLVGGDYDTLFLGTPSASLSFIYTSLGCFHTLQPEKDPFAPPSVPALTPQGFVKWQMVQLLLEPGEHVPFLQQAVKRFELVDPVDGTRFPRLLPREALPDEPDESMIRWHENVSDRLLLEAEATRKALRSGHSHEDNTSTDTSLEISDAESSVLDGAEQRAGSHQEFRNSVTMPLPQRQWKQRGPLQSQVHRRRSLAGELHSPYPAHNTPKHADQSTSPTLIHRQRRRLRMPSSASESSTSSSSTDDDRGLIVNDLSTGQACQPVNQFSAAIDLDRCSTTKLYQQPRYFIPPHDPHLHTKGTQPQCVQPFDISQGSPYLLASRYVKGSDVRARGKDVCGDSRKSGSAPGTPSGQLCRRARLVEGTGNVGQNEQRGVCPVRGVGGRRYATISWK